MKDVNDILFTEGNALRKESLRLEEMIDNYKINYINLSSEYNEIANKYRHVCYEIDEYTNKNRSKNIIKSIINCLGEFTKDSIYLWTGLTIIYSVATGSLNLGASLLPSVILSGTYNGFKTVGEIVSTNRSVSQELISELQSKKNEYEEKMKELKAKKIANENYIINLSIERSKIQSQITKLIQKHGIDIDALNINNQENEVNRSYVIK